MSTMTRQIQAEPVPIQPGLVALPHTPKKPRVKWIKWMSAVGLAVFIAAGTLLWRASVQLAGMQENSLRTGSGNMGDVWIPVGSGQLPAFVSAPEQPAPWPGVVVLHDVAGMSEDLRNQTRWLAKSGFLAAAPNLFFRGGKIKCLLAIARDLKARCGPTYDDVEPVRTWLIQQPGCNGKIGVI